ncbi:MAG TPA: phosphoribosylformylglycinamidine cyclo-ligase [Thermodesulfobacteriota bacterium]|nr:phosphoribosylformylglycinamidine cyclo-ligase [Thermodesulfobacteriota bacterium]
MKRSLTYKQSGVSIDEGEKLVRFIKPLAKATYTKGVVAGVGGFGAPFSLKFKKLKDPILVSGTDGVGTKLKVAFMADRHDSIGIDLVAMCVNDIVTSGAEPLFFLDYFATGRLNAEKASMIIKSIAKGCKLAGCALVGGETAEMPGLYKKGEYDLAGFAVGAVERQRLIDGRGIKPGDAIIGIASSGLHSNGYSLARKVLFEKLRHKLSDKPKRFKKTIGEELLTPTKIYVKSILRLIQLFDIKGVAHITGGGITENVPRVLPEGVKAVIREGSWDVPRIFGYMKEKGNIKETEMRRTFNMGIGMVLIAKKNQAASIIKELKRVGDIGYIIGTIEKKKPREKEIEFVK